MNSGTGTYSQTYLDSSTGIGTRKAFNTTASLTGAFSSGMGYLFGVDVSASITGASTGGIQQVYGGRFITTGTTAGTSSAYGIYASASGADTNYAGYFGGNLYATGTITFSGLTTDGVVTVSSGVLGSSATLALANGGTGASLSDPGGDRIMFWDDSAGAVTWLTVGTGLTLTDTTLTATAGGYTAGNDIDFTGAGSDVIDIESTLNYVSTITRDSSDLTLSTTTSGNLVLNPFGNVSLSASIIPDADDTYDIGSATYRIRDLYLGGESIHIGTGATDEGLISYDTTNNIFNFGTDSTTNGDIAFNTDDLYVDKGTGRIGIGATYSGNYLGELNVLKQFATGTTGLLGSYLLSRNLGSTGGSLTGIRIQNMDMGTSLPLLYGLNIEFGDAIGTSVTTVYGVRSYVYTEEWGSPVTTNYGGYFDASFAVTNYGIYVTAHDGTNNYAIYSLTGNNYFGGNVGIGDTSPASLLAVGNGDLFQVTSTGTVSTTAGITSGNALGITFASGSHSGSLRGLSVDMSNISGNTDQYSLYGVYVNNPSGIADEGDSVGLYIDGTNWGSGIYNEATTYLNGQLSLGGDASIYMASGTGTFSQYYTRSTVSIGTHNSLSSTSSLTGVYTSGGTELRGIYGLATISGVSTGGNQSAYGGYFVATGNNTGAATSTAYGIYASASGADTNYAAYLNGNILAGGTISGLTGISSSGTVTFSGLGTSSAVYTDGSSNLTTTAPVSGTIGYWSRTSTTLSPATSGDGVSMTGLLTADGGIQVDTNNFTVSGTNGTITQTSSILTGNAINVAFDAGTQTGAMVGMNMNFSGITDAAYNFYGIQLTAHTGTASTSYGIYIPAGNWDYGIYNADALYTGSTTVSGTYSQTYTSTTTTANTYNAHNVSTTFSGIFTAGTTNLRGVTGSATMSGVSTGGSQNVSGGYFTAAGNNTGAATSTAYGVYATASGGDGNIGGYFSGTTYGISAIGNGGSGIAGYFEGDVVVVGSSSSLTVGGDITNDSTTLGTRMSLTASTATQIPVFIADPASTTRTLVTRTPAQLRTDIGAEAAFSKGGFVQGTGVSLSGTLTSRLVSTGDVTIGFNYSSTLAGNPTLTTGQSTFASTGIIFEGATADGFEGLLTVSDITTADKTWTLPNADGTLLVAEADTLGTVTGRGATTSTNSTFDRTLTVGSTLYANGGTIGRSTNGSITINALNTASNSVITLVNSDAVQQANVNISDGDFQIGGTTVLNSSRNISNITSYSQSAGNFSISGTGTFGTGTGAISLNGSTTVSATSNLNKTSGTGTISLVTTATTSGAITLSNTGATLSGNSGIALTSGATTGTGIVITTDSATTGYGLSISANALTSGAGVYLRSTSTAGLASNHSYGLRIEKSGATVASSHYSVGISSLVSNTGASHVNYAGIFEATGTGTTSENTALFATAFGGTTSNYAIYTDDGNNYLNGTSGTTSIGIAPDSAYQLKVAGQMSINQYIYHNSDSDTWLGFNGSDNVTLGTSGTLRFQTTSTGQIYFNSGLGSASGGGQVLRINTTTWEVYRDTSSLKYKENVENITENTSNIYNLRPVSFTLKSSGYEDFGLIAEEVYTQFPKLVTLDAFGNPDGVNYDRISVLLLNEMIKNKPILDNLQAKVTDLESQFETGSTLSDMLADYELGLLGGNVDTSTQTITYVGVVANSITGGIITGTIINGTSATFNSLAVASGFSVTTEGNVSIAGDLVLGTNTISSGTNIISTTSDLDVNQLFATKINIKNTDPQSASTGEVVFVPGVTEIVVDTTVVTESSYVFTSIESSVGDHAVFITEKTNGSFKLTLNKALTESVKVYWWVIN